MRYNPEQMSDSGAYDRPQPPGARLTVIGAGLAGTEAAWQLACRGHDVILVEMRPRMNTPAHHTDRFAELVCSNSLKGTDPDTAAGLLKQELESLGSIVLAAARTTAVPAGSALAVDRDSFSGLLTRLLSEHPRITVDRREATSLPEGTALIATGPLTSDGLEPALSGLIGADRLAFYDAAAPIVDAETIDRTAVFEASRYGKGGADYLNCPMDEDRYRAFRSALVSARTADVHDFESRDLFQACMPIEEIARKGEDALRYGPMKPVGLTDPSTGERPYAVVQLRSENRERTAYNLVGFQTNLAFAEQRRVFSLIPGLAHTEFLRYGVMHRNTFVDAPRVLDPDLSVRTRPEVFLAGQITGTEGYLEAAATGLLAALNMDAHMRGHEGFVLPATTALGSLIAYATDPDTKPYQPMHVNFGLLPPLDPPVRGKRNRYAAYADRARHDLHAFLASREDFRPCPGPSHPTVKAPSHA